MELAGSLLGLAEIVQTLAEEGLLVYGVVLGLDFLDDLSDFLCEDQLLAFLGFEEDLEDLFGRKVLEFWHFQGSPLANESQ